MSPKEAKKTTLVVIDGNAIIHRAYHALPPLTTKDGTIVNAVFGFTSMLLKVMEDLKPTHIAVTFDVAGGTFRDTLYTEYKAKRVKADQALYDQIPLVHNLLKEFGVPIYTKEGFEADDVIGTIVKEQAKKVDEIVIVTGDNDLLQLVGGNVKVDLLRKGLSDVVLFDEKKVEEKYGFAPPLIVDYKALRGDTSDNIPGIKGIGEKTATDLIQTFGDIDSLYKALAKGAKNKDIAALKPAVLAKLTTGEADARMSRQLAEIHAGVPDVSVSLGDADVEKFDRSKLADLLRRFEFFSLIKRVNGSSTGSKEAKKAESKKTQTAFTRVTAGNIDALFGALESSVFVCREVVAGPDVFTQPLLGLVFYVGKQSWYVDLEKMNTTDRARILAIFIDKDKLLVGHDVKALIKRLYLEQTVIQNRLFDVMIASYLIDSSSRAHDLPAIIGRELEREAPVAVSQGNLFGVNPQAAAEEAELIWTIYERFAGKLEETGNRGLFDTVEMPLIPVLAEMELNGIAIDSEQLHTLSQEVKTAIDTITKKIWKEAGEEFNVASSTQLRDILFEKMKLPIQGVKKGKTGFSTAASELEKLRDLHPIIPMIEEHRELAKLQNTYVDVLPTLVHPKTGRIHTTFNQAVAATGRLSSTDPNLQNIPVRTELGRKIRDAFVAAPGLVLVSADYSQIELRIVASLAQDEKMLQIFSEGKDIHQATAAAIHGVSLDKVTKQMRYAAKEVNFGVLYGMGAFGLAWRAGISHAEAKEFIDKYFQEFAGVKRYVDQTLLFAKKEGYVETLFGRRRYIPELKADNFQLRNAGERMAVNMPIQGTAADLMKMAMIAVAKVLPKEAKMLLQVHDEMVFEVKKGHEEAICALVKTAMEGVAQLRVPIEVRVSTGKHWGEMK